MAVTTAIFVPHCTSRCQPGVRASPPASPLPAAAWHPDFAARWNTWQQYQGSRARPVLSAAEKQAAGAVQPTEWLQRLIELPPLSRGCHVITRQLLKQLPELAEFEVALVNIFVQHTSCSLTINENASPDVPLDLADSLDRLAPEGSKVQYRHDDEGPDDMPAHVKSSLMGMSLLVPVQHGRLALGVWQGIYLNEHRNHGGPRRLVVTVQGQKRADGHAYSSYW